MGLDRIGQRDQRIAPQLGVTHHLLTAFFERAVGQAYLRYLARRHPDGSMADDTSLESYRRFLVDPWGGETRFLELRLADRVVGVAVTDTLPHGLSAVYTFFEPDQAERGLGTFAVLAQIETARRLGLPYVYLGYWIEESRKMAYKAHFQPIGGMGWASLDAPATHTAHRDTRGRSRALNRSRHDLAGRAPDRIVGSSCVILCGFTSPRAVFQYT